MWYMEVLKSVGCAFAIGSQQQAIFYMEIIPCRNFFTEILDQRDTFIQ